MSEERHSGEKKEVEQERGQETSQKCVNDCLFYQFQCSVYLFIFSILQANAP